MSRDRHFQVDYAGHSIMVNVHTRAPHELELLVDGKEVVKKELHGTGTYLLADELPDERPEEPAHPFRVRVREPRMGFGTPTCVFEIDGMERPMHERAAA